VTAVDARDGERDEARDGEQDDAARVSPTETRPVGRFNAIGVPTERSKNFGAAVRELGRLLSSERGRLILVAVLSVGSVVSQVFGPKVLGHGTDLIIRGIGHGHIDFGRLHGVLIEALVLYTGSAALSLLTAFTLAGVVQRLMFRLRRSVEDKIHALPLRYIDHESRGDLLSRVTNDIDNIAQSLQQTLSQMLNSVLLLVGVAVIMFTISPLLAAVALTTVPVSVFLMQKIGSRARPRYIAQWRATGGLNAIVEARLELIRVRRTRLAVQFGGAAGTMAALSGRGLDVMRELSVELTLAEPTLPWHTARARLVEVAAALGVAAGVAGKVALDVALMAQTEVGEVFERSVVGRAGSSALPQKHNPVDAIEILAAVRGINAQVTVLLGAMLQEHERAAGAWQAEWPAFGETLRLAGGAVSRLASLLAGLQVDQERMRHLHKALSTLSERQREAVVARTLDDRGPGEIAADLGVSVGTVDSLLLRGRRRLARAYHRMAEERGAAAAGALVAARRRGRGGAEPVVPLVLSSSPAMRFNCSNSTLSSSMSTSSSFMRARTWSWIVFMSGNAASFA